MHPLLNKERQKKAEGYDTKKRLWSIITAALEFAFLIGALAFRFNIILYRAFNSIRPVFRYLIWSVIIVAAAQIVSLIPSFISGYLLEKKYGFMKQSVRGWFLDLGKGLLLEILLAWIVLMLFGWVVGFSHKTWWAVFAFVIFLFQGLLAVIFPVLILPIFHKYSRIKDKELTSKLQSVMDRAGLKVLGFYREDSSGKTAHDNAFFTGLGATRRIVLYDNLIENYTPEEIEAVIGHEAAHRKKNHIVKLMFLSLAETLLISLLIQFFLIRCYPDFFRGGTDILPALFAVMLIFGAVSGVLQTALNYVSRRFEYEADIGALRYTGKKQPLISMLAKLADRNLSDAYPPEWVKLIFLSHPPIGERIEYVEKYEEKTRS